MGGLWTPQKSCWPFCKGSCAFLPTWSSLSRVDMFLKELCLGSTGSTTKVTFEDFLHWWLKYFRDESPRGKAPFEEFYCQVRRLGWNRRDPPVHNGIIKGV